MRTFAAAALIALATAAAPAAYAAPAAQAGPCARTPGSIYWEVCVARNGCLVYVWSTMPPAICL